MFSVRHLVIPFASVCLLKAVVCHPYLEEYEDMSDNSVSSPYYSQPYGPPRPDFSSYPRYPPMTPMDRFSPEDEYSSCPRPGIHRRLRPIKMHAALRPIIFREPSRCPGPIIIEHNAPKPPPTLLSPITKLINSFVQSIFPQSYYGEY